MSKSPHVTEVIKRVRQWYEIQAVVEYLADRGIRLDPAVIRERIVPEIIFMNPRLELDPSVEALPEIFSRREVIDTLNVNQKRDVPWESSRPSSPVASAGNQTPRARLRLLPPR